MPVTVKYTGKSLDAMLRDFLRAKQQIPKYVKIMALEFYHNSFQNQGFTDASFQPWRTRKGEKRAVYFGRRIKLRGKKDGRANRAILEKDGTLRRSLNGKVSGSTVFIFTDSPYATVHNEGGRAGRNHSARIPKRQFMGRSRMLDADIQRMIQKEVRNALIKL